MTPQEEARVLAGELMRLSRSTLLTELRFLSPALCRMPLTDDPDCVGMATDGMSLRYHFVYVLRRWQVDPASVSRGLLHMVLHCVFHHPFMDSGRLYPACWDLACDIAVERVIDELGLPSLRQETSDDALEILAELNRDLKGRLTAERIYRRFLDSGLSENQLEQLRVPFQRDDHSLWYQLSEQESGQRGKSDDDGDGSSKNSDSNARQRRGESDSETAGTGRETARSQRRISDGSPQAAEAAAKEWQRIAAQVQTDLETHSREWSDRAGGMALNLREGRRSRLRFSDFLRRFGVLTEVPAADLDSWDNMLYSYGIDLYGDMPLIEPLEYCEKKRVRSLVIVIDTSGSVQGERIQSFLNTACGLLMAEDSFDHRTELRILECDAQVQRDTRIASRKALEAFLKTFQLHGGGGTDFRPAFEHVAELQKQGELRELKGILYLTDGEGTYPVRAPGCDTAFLFVDREDAETPVPPWAMRVLLDERTFDQPEILYFQT